MALHHLFTPIRVRPLEVKNRVVWRRSTSAIESELYEQVPREMTVRTSLV